MNTHKEIPASIKRTFCCILLSQPVNGVEWITEKGKSSISAVIHNIFTIKIYLNWLGKGQQGDAFVSKVAF